MITIPQRWSRSVCLLFIIRIGLAGASPTILRSNGAKTAPLAELQSSSCSQQLERIKMETRRHVSALNAITDNSIRTGWRNRKLLAATSQPIAFESTPIPSALNSPEALADSINAPSITRKTKEKVTDDLGKYLRSSDDSEWVSKCLSGGKCRRTDEDYLSNDTRASEPPGSARNTANVTVDPRYSADNGTSGVAVVVNENPSFHASQSANVSDVSKIKQLQFTRVIDLMPITAKSTKGSETDASRPEVGKSIGSQNYAPLNSKEPIVDSESRKPGYDDLQKQFDANRYHEPVRTTNFMTGKEETPDHDYFPHSSSRFYQSSFGRIGDTSDAFGTGAMPSQSSSIRYPPNTDGISTYSNHFLPLTIQVSPMTYYQRYPRDDEVSNSGAEKTLARISELRDTGLNGTTNEKVIFDNIVANYGQDLFKRGSTGKRESGFYDPNPKTTVTTSYPEAPSPSTDTSDRKLFTKFGQGENGIDSNIYLFVGGNWVANFKENPELFYINQPYREPLRAQPFAPFAQTISNIYSALTHNQSPPSINPNCPSTHSLISTPDSDRTPSYPSKPYAVDERILEMSKTAAGSRSSNANEMKWPSTFAARNAWYDYDSSTNQQSTPANVPFSGGPVAYSNVGQLSNTPSGNEHGISKQNMDDLSYDDSLVNFPRRKYEPPVVGAHDAASSKPEDFMIHDINTPDMLAVGTQMLTVLPPLPSELPSSDDLDGPSYGILVADESARSGPRIFKPTDYPIASTFNNNAIDTPTRFWGLPRAQPTNRPAPSQYFPSAPSWPNEFEFVSGQWVKRKLPTEIGVPRFIYDGMRKRQSGELNVMGWPNSSPSNHFSKAEPVKPNSKCLR